MTIEKMDLKTPDITDGNVARIAELFPNVVTEGRGKNGELVRVVDFDALRQELSASIVEGPQERYRLDWPGKRGAMLAANTPITKTLRPVRAESVDFDNTKNLFIEGDNLDALKLLQETYLGKVKMIYIDPPYNTGKDFIYKDNFTQGKDEYMEDSGQVDEDGGRLVANPDSNGRYHSDWLSMMYPRLKLARNLLRDDGVIFISIDESEIENLKTLCDAIFGENNFRNTFILRRYDKNINRQFMNDGLKTFNTGFEYILCYARSSEFSFAPIYKEASDKRKSSGYWKGFWNDADRPTMRYDILGFTPTSGQWKWSKKKAIEAVKNYQIFVETFSEKTSIEDYWKQNGESLKFIRRNPNGKGKNLGVEHWIPPSQGILRNTSWLDILASKSTSSVKGLFDFPKNPEAIQVMLEAQFGKDTLVLDFFAGSGTTAEAISQLNAKDGGTRKYILVQLPEKTHAESAAAEMGYSTISDLAKKRIRRAGDKILADNPDQVGKLDIGFRVLKIDSSNMNDVYYAPQELDQKNLLDTVEHIKPDRSAEDLLFQVMLDWGVDLSLSIVRETVDGKTVYYVGDNDLAACFDMKITEDLVKAMAVRKPLRAVFRDDGFTSDDMKINAGQLFNQMTDGHTDMKVI